MASPRTLNPTTLQSPSVYYSIFDNESIVDLPPSKTMTILHVCFWTYILARHVL